MMYALGVITGLLISALVVLLESRLKAQNINVIERLENLATPKSTGAIFEPPSEQDLARDMIIQKNREVGLDTKISELL